MEQVSTWPRCKIHRKSLSILKMRSPIRKKRRPNSQTTRELCCLYFQQASAVEIVLLFANDNPRDLFVSGRIATPIAACRGSHSSSAGTTHKWLADVGMRPDGIMAKPLDQPYRPGERIMRKFKAWHTVDGVLAGYYEDEATKNVDSLLFGLYGDDGLLHFVGHSRVYDDAAEIAGYSSLSRAAPASPDARRREEPLDRQDAEDGPPRAKARRRTQRRPHSGGQFRHGSRLSAGAPTRLRRTAGWIRSSVTEDGSIRTDFITPVVDPIPRLPGLPFWPRWCLMRRDEGAKSRKRLFDAPE